MKAYGYMRVSGKAQIDGDGFPRQQLAIAKYAAANGIDVIRYFREAAVPGATEAAHRPAFAEMRALMVANGVKVVVVEALHRFARDLMVQEAAIADFKKHGLTLISVCEPDLDSAEPSRIMIRQILGAVSQYEKSILVIKMRGAREKIRARGDSCEGAKPYGNSPKRPEEAEVLEMLVRWKREGMNLSAMVKRLNESGVKPRRGKQWHPYAISRILERQK